MTACSEAQIIALSKDLEATTSLTARRSLAVRSMNAGTLPAPTPRAGLPQEYAALTMALPPVARISATSGWFIRASVIAIEGLSTHWMQCSGAPASIAASRTTRAASAEDCCADGWKAKTIGLRVFSEIRLLKMAVEVGLVTGCLLYTSPS